MGHNKVNVLDKYEVTLKHLHTLQYPISMTSLVVKSRDLCEPYSIVSFLMDLVVFVVSMVDLITCGVVFFWEKMKVQEQGWRLLGGSSGVLPRRHRR